MPLTTDFLNDATMGYNSKYLQAINENTNQNFCISAKFIDSV